jgi:methyl-accepting chemotaxis protein
MVAVVLMVIAMGMLLSPLRDLARAMTDLGSGDADLNVRLSVHGQDELGVIAQGFNQFVGKVNQSMQVISEASHSVQIAATEIANGNADLSSRTEQTASNLEETVASMEQLSTAVAHSAEGARSAAELAREASRIADEGRQQVSEVVSTMASIEQSAQRISEIIGVIDSIAFQTNILALNAAVEAARAGDQGRGFAVVASEVRSLAQRSAQAAKEIKELIQGSVDRVSAGSVLVDRTGKTIHGAVEAVGRVSTLIQDISTSASEQSTGIGQINSAVGQLDQMTQQNAALVEESSAAAMSLREQADRLAAEVKRFRLQR